MTPSDLKFLKSWGLHYFQNRQTLLDNTYQYPCYVKKNELVKIPSKDVSRFISLLKKDPKFFRKKTKDVFEFKEFVSSIYFEKVQCKPALEFVLKDQFLRMKKSDAILLFETLIELNFKTPFDMMRYYSYFFNQKQFCSYLTNQNMSHHKFEKYFGSIYSVFSFASQAIIDGEINSDEYISLVSKYLNEGHKVSHHSYFKKEDSAFKTRGDLFSHLFADGRLDQYKVFKFLSSHKDFQEDMDRFSMQYALIKPRSENEMRFINIANNHLLDKGLYLQWTEEKQKFYEIEIQHAHKKRFTEKIQNIA